MARTPMARLPRLFRTRSWVSREKSRSCRHYYICDNLVWFSFLLNMACCVYSLESPRWGDFNEITQHAFMLKKIKKYSYYATWPGALVNPHWLDLPLSRSNFFMVPKCSSHWRSTVDYTQKCSSHWRSTVDCTNFGYLEQRRKFKSRATN